MSLHLSSRFEVLKVQSAVNHDSKRTQQKPKKSNVNKQAPAVSENAKKRARKKKRQQQLQNEREELRGMTFLQKGGTGGSKPTNQTHEKEGPPTCGQPPANQVAAHKPEANQKNAHSSGANHIPNPPDTWRDRDEELLDQQFEEDLQKALMESRVQEEERRMILTAIKDLPLPAEEPAEKEEKKKKKQQPMSLQEFHSNNSSNKEDNPTTQTPQEPSVDDVVKDDTFFEDIETETSVILKKEHRKKKRHSQSEEEDPGEVIRSLQFKEELREKDEENKLLKTVLKKQKDELSQVKKRNKQLCFILAQGEMKDKAEVLKQMEELTSVKDELTEEVQELHKQLEQERSKVSSLKSELQKYQDRKK